MSSDPYNAETRRRFGTMAFSGDVPGGVSARRRTDEVDILLSARVDDGRFAELRYRAWGCPHTLAACDWVCEHFTGAALSGATEPLIPLISETLSVPTEKTGRIIALEDALRDLRSRAKEQD